MTTVSHHVFAHHVFVRIVLHPWLKTSCIIASVLKKEEKWEAKISKKKKTAPEERKLRNQCVNIPIECCSSFPVCASFCPRASSHFSCLVWTDGIAITALLFAYVSVLLFVTCM